MKDPLLLALVVGAIMVSATCIYQHDKITNMTMSVSKCQGDVKSTNEVLGRARERISVLEAMVDRDDELLDWLLQGTWDRDCGYRPEPWTQLADGKIRQQLIQVCD